MVGSALAQGTPVKPEEFTANPARFDGQTISVSGSIINLDGIDITAQMGNANGPSQAGVGMGAPGAPMGGAPAKVVRCNAPMGFKVIDIDFKVNPTFSACFGRPQARDYQCPKGKDRTGNGRG